MATGKSEKLQWIMVVMNTIHSIFDTIGDATSKIPESWKQRLPGFLGLSLADEQIFWGVVGRLVFKKQVLIMRFFKERCKDYERNRFINIVAGMEVSQEKLPESEEKFDKEGNLTYKKTKGGSPGIDYRFTFLDSFADVIETEFGNDLDRAYEHCIGGRMIIADPMHQKVLRRFSESVGWFKRVVLTPLGSIDLAGITKSAYTQIESGAKKVNDTDKKWAPRTAKFFIGLFFLTFILGIVALSLI